MPLRLSSPLVDSGGIAEAVASFTVAICTSLRIYARTSEVAAAARGDTTSCPSVHLWAIQLVEEVPSSALATTLTEFCVCRGHDPGDGDRGFFSLYPFCLLLGRTE